MIVRMNGFDREPEDLIAEELAAVESVIRSGWWVLGENVDRFEHAWSERTGAVHTVGVANGMEALQIGMTALGIGPGDEVITTPMTAFATVLAVMATGAAPVLADIDPDTGILDVASVSRCLSPATKAVVLVHLYGQAGPVDDLIALCAANGVHLIEDCAQAHDATVAGRRVGTFGTFAAFSFYPTKNLGAVGDAGALVTNSDVVAENARSLRNYGQTVRYVHDIVGRNSRLDELQAAILNVRLPYLDRWTSARRRIASTYDAEIRHEQITVMPPPSAPLAHVHHLYVVRCERRDDLREHLASRGVESLAHYPIPIHGQRPTSQLRRDAAGLGWAEQHARQCLSIPCHPHLTPAEADHVIDAINSFSR